MGGGWWRARGSGRHDDEAMIGGGHVLEVLGGVVFDGAREGEPACAEPEEGEEADPGAVFGVGAAAVPVEDAQAEGHGDDLEGDDGEWVVGGHDEAGDGIEFDHADGLGEEEGHFEVGEADEHADDDEDRDAEGAGASGLIGIGPARDREDAEGVCEEVGSVHDCPLTFGERIDRGKGWAKWDW